MKNTGSRAGAEIAEVYASLPDATNEPPKRLVGFTKVWLKPGESQPEGDGRDRSEVSERVGRCGAGMEAGRRASTP